MIFRLYDGGNTIDIQFKKKKPYFEFCFFPKLALCSPIFSCDIQQQQQLQLPESPAIGGKKRLYSTGQGTSELVVLYEFST